MVTKAKQDCVEVHLYGDDDISVILHGGHGDDYEWIVNTHDGKHEFRSQETFFHRREAMRDVIGFLARNIRF